jgi:hypothetical protein
MPKTLQQLTIFCGSDLKGTKVKVYLIRKEAVYNHEILGVYSTLKLAKQAFKDMYRKIEANKEDWHSDFDGHHDYYIYKIPLDKPFSTLEDGRFLENPECKIRELKYTPLIAKDYK